jgi:hypothetical protein
MTKYLCLAVLLVDCPSTTENDLAKAVAASDSLSLARMIQSREQAMIDKELQSALDQLASDITWINSQGYYFVGKEEVTRFHEMLVGNDSLDYEYEAGQPLIRVLGSRHAMAYYPWKMFWYRRSNPADTVNREAGH